MSFRRMLPYINLLGYNVVEKKTFLSGIFPLEDFRPFNGKVFYVTNHETRLDVTLMHNAAIRGRMDVVALLLMLKAHDVNDDH
ncbi:hypothetical protein CEP53_003878 [Fusarium sp. AF-6]|nr:hypothetical protein CEP53_003878 [Fusarium sp. AF-6]